MLEVTAAIQIPEEEFQWSFARSGGPGGQNVNKVASKAVLRWNVAARRSFSCCSCSMPCSAARKLFVTAARSASLRSSRVVRLRSDARHRSRSSIVSCSWVVVASSSARASRK